MRCACSPLHALPARLLAGVFPTVFALDRPRRGATPPRASTPPLPPRPAVRDAERAAAPGGEQAEMPDEPTAGSHQGGAPEETRRQPNVPEQAAGAADSRSRHTGGTPGDAGPQGGDKEAYVTLVTTSKYLIGAEVLAKSLRAFHASRPLLALVDSSLPVMLAAAFAVTRPPPSSANAPYSVSGARAHMPSPLCRSTWRRGWRRQAGASSTSTT
jgi:hypothetical protein